MADDPLGQMKAVMDAMVAQAKEFAKYMKDAAKSADSFGGGGGGGVATGAVSGPSAAAGQGGNTGAAASVGMKLGSITVPGLRLTPPGNGGHQRPNVGPGGSAVIRGAAEGFNRVIAPAVEAGFDFARVSVPQASDRDFGRYRAGLVGRTGSDFDRLVENIGMGTDLTNLTQAADTFLSSGYAARAGGLQQFGSITRLGLASGMGSSAAVSAQLGTQQASSRWGLMGMGIAVRDQNGKPLSPEAIINQIVNKTGVAGMSEEEIAAELMPGVGNLHQSLTNAGLTQEQIEVYRPGLIEAATGGPLRKGELEDLDVAKSAEVTADITQSEAEKVGAFADPVIEGMENAAERISDFTDALTGELRYLGEEANQVGAQMDILAEEALPKWLAFLPDQSVYDNDSSGPGKATRGFWENVIGWIADKVGYDPPNYATGSAEGDMNISMDGPRNVHAGEMIIPARIATAVRSEMAAGRAAPTKTTLGNGFGMGEGGGSGGSASVTINVHVQQASEAEAMRLASMVQRYLKNDRELTGLSLGQMMA